MSSRHTVAGRIVSALLVSLALAGCESSPATPSPTSPVIAVALSQASPDSMSSTAQPPTTEAPSAAASGPTTIPPDPTIADLTGVTTDPTLAHRLPLAVLIDDNRIARPQSGFNGA